MVSIQHLTLDEFLALPADEPALELEPDGTVAQKVSPKGKHSWLQFTMCDRINRFAEPGRLARAFPNFARSLATRRMFLASRCTGGIASLGAPTVKSPTTSDCRPTWLWRSSPPIKAPMHFCGGASGTSSTASTAFLVDPIDRSVVRFSTGAQPSVLRGDDAISMGDLLPDFQLSVTDLFAELRLP